MLNFFYWYEINFIARCIFKIYGGNFESYWEREKYSGYTRIIAALENCNRPG
jgi:hypothetical protein